MVYIEDEIHSEQEGPFDTFEDAVAELRRLAAVPWDAPPNRPPCASWRTCGREYHVLEFDERGAPWELLRNVRALDISANGVAWVEGYEQAWAQGAAT